ncbi:MAG TPA: type II and III secretion system protein [Solimonas sp.]|nr:type II and III secretion system protein [Solimonas sp.]
MSLVLGLCAGAAAAQFPMPQQFPQAQPQMPLAPSMPAPGPRSGIATLAYAPSFVQTDRVLAALKAMGYTVIEFSAQSDGTARDKVFTPLSVIGPGTVLPAIIKLPDAEKSSLLDPAPPPPQSANGQMFGGQQQPQQFGGQQQGPVISAVPDIGGSYLHNVTAGGADQRLLIVYDPADFAGLARLQGLLHNQIDVAARQVVIEALVIEVRRDRITDLGINFSGTDNQGSVDFQRSDQGAQLPLVLSFDDALVDVLGTFRASLRALVTQGDAEVLSNPSVLVMDGRQARIQIGQQIPISNSTTNFGSTQESIQYFPVGIVLNLRPRISENQKEVSMQVETIVSSVNASAAGIRSESGALRAPVVDNRQVQTFVRVADNTPFIIGGLISTEKTDKDTGVPFLSDIPLLGWLFKRNNAEKRKNEVIVVLTPHIAPMDDASFSYTRPKDSPAFDSSDNQLFRDSYRIRSGEVFDLAYLRDSAALRELRNAASRVAVAHPELAQDPDIASVLGGGIPGEAILVRRMLWETIRNSGYAKHINPERIVLFERLGAGRGGYRLVFLHDLLAKTPAGQSLLLAFMDPGGGQFEQPAVVPVHVADTLDYGKLMEEQNAAPTIGPQTWTLVLRKQGNTPTSPFEWLRGALVLKRILDLNSTLPLTIKEFYGGRQLVYPTEQDLAQGFQIVDLRTAQYWYEIQNYYPAFEREFNRVQQRITALDQPVPVPGAP